MSALEEDALEQLARSRAAVLKETGNEKDGFRFEYRLDKSVGTFTIYPVVVTPPSRMGRKWPLTDGTEYVTVKIEQTEKWFPKGA